MILKFGKIELLTKFKKNIAILKRKDYFFWKYFLKNRLVSGGKFWALMDMQSSTV
jgi:hypothetical protein